MSSIDPIPETRRIAGYPLSAILLRYGLIPGILAGLLVPVMISFSKEMPLLNMLSMVGFSVGAFILIFCGVAAGSWWVMKRIAANTPES